MDGGTLRSMTQLPENVPFMAASALANPQADIYHRLLQDRIVVLGTDVNDEIANLHHRPAPVPRGSGQGQADIWLYINSPGGSVTAGMAIYDTMQFVDVRRRHHLHGSRRVDGAVPALRRRPGKRYALPHARIMMHQPLGGVQGQATDIAIQAEQMAYIKRLMARSASRYHTGQTVEQIESDSDRDRWFTAEEAKEYGIIDHVIVKRGEML